VVSYQIREQFYNFVPRQPTIEDSFPKKLEYTIYMLCLKEWNIDSIMYRYLWNPLKWAGRKLDFLVMNRALLYLLPIYLIGLYAVYHKSILPELVLNALPKVFSVVGLVFVLKSFTERTHARMSWILVIMNHFWVALAVAFNENFSFSEIHLYLIGVAVSGVVGYLVLLTIKKREHTVDLNQFHGYSWKHPKLAMLFLLACLGASGFPITPTFIGEDLIFSHIHENQVMLAASTALSLILDGIAIIRIYARVFLGPHAKSVYEMGYRSS
jgi:NADH-quinone oxidoreductase subunit L